MGRNCRVLLVEPYCGGSHAAWVEGLVRYSRHKFEVLSHPGAFWKWRMRGSALTLAEEAERVIVKSGEPDVVLVSGMIDLAAWLGFSRRFLGDAPVVLYLHENQFGYPLGPRQRIDEGLQLINWISMAVADEVWFNSAFQHDSLFDLLPNFLEQFPDHLHIHQLRKVKTNCKVMTVGVELSDISVSVKKTSGKPPLVLWNHRWDYDKNPSAVFGSLIDLASEGVEFQLAITGENTRSNPREIIEACKNLSDRLVHVGYLPRPEYTTLLDRVDVVVSASIQEFFGISVVEAIAAGAIPVLPNRLSYPELVTGDFYDAALYSEGELTSRLRSVLCDLDRWLPLIEGLDRSIRRFDWSSVVHEYDDRLEYLAFT